MKNESADHSNNVIYDWSAMPEDILFDFFKRGITTDIFGKPMSDEQIKQSVKRIKARE